jgi:hypothetical protein
MPSFGGFLKGAKNFRSPVKHFRQSTIITTVDGLRRRWLIVDRRFDRNEKLFVHLVVPA